MTAEEEEEAEIVNNANTSPGGEIEAAAGTGPGFQSASSLLRSQDGAGAEAGGQQVGFLSPRFRSAAAMAGWDEEALLVASLVVEDTPVRELKDKKRAEAPLKSPPTTNSRRKRRSRRQTTPPVPPVTLRLDDEETTGEVIPGPEEKITETKTAVADEEKREESIGDPPEEAPAAAIPCMDRLREELSCAICLDICFEPSTTPCGHSFCKKCLKRAAAKCGKRCPKCRELIISNGRGCIVNTVLWNTIQLLFPEEIEEARKKALPANSCDRKPRTRSPDSGSSIGTNRRSMRNPRSRLDSIRSAAQAVRPAEGDGGRPRRRTAAPPGQSEDAALALRLQREEFMGAFRETQQPQRSTVYLARASLRAMASRAIQLHNRRRS